MSAAGYISLVLALIVSIYTIFTSITSANQRKTALVNTSRKSTVLTFGLVSLSVLVLAIALVTHDFGIEYVASYTSRDLPFPYLISGIWAGNAGSLLFWGWLLALSGAIFALKSRSDDKLTAYSLAVIAITQVFFLIMLLFAKNPFTRLPTPPPDGIGLNPLLENPAMVIHPPLLLAGYVLFTVPFALAIAALITGKLNDDWLTRARPWAIAAWLFLGLGNLIGAWWAYVELGWGGYWAWDPVENAGLMPWLVATAFLHSIAMQRRRGMFKQWTVLLIILTFFLTIFGTFLTRSNFLSSVHTFGESTLTPYFLIFLFLTFLVSFGLFYYRREELKSSGNIESFISKDNAYLVNNVLLLGATLVIFFGTMFPAFAEIFSGDRVEVGKSFFNTVNSPIFLVIILLAGLCVLTGWRRLPAGDARRMVLPSAVAMVVIVALLVARATNLQAAIAFGICAFAFSATLSQWAREVLAHRGVESKKTPAGATPGFFWNNKDRYGAYIVHLALALMAVGVIGSSIFGVEEEAILRPGESMKINGYTVTYDKMDFSGNENKMVISTTLSVYEGDRLVSHLTPQKYLHRNFEQPVTEVAIHSTPAEDLYAILADWDSTRTAAFQLLVNPLVMWIWIGGGLFFVGGLICFLPKKDRVEPPQKEKARSR